MVLFFLLGMSFIYVHLLMDIDTFKLGIIFLILGLSLFILSFIFYQRQKLKITTYLKSQGKIIDLVGKCDYGDNSSLSPLIEFKTHEGRRIRITSEMSTQRGWFRIGQKIEILYPKKHPEEAVINTYWSLWLIPTFFGILGGLSVLVCMSVFVMELIMK